MKAMQFDRLDKYTKFGMAKHIIPVVALGGIAFLAYGLFYAPVLYSDDWSVILGRWYANKLNWFDLTEQRPLLMARFRILYGIFGLNLHAFYFVLWMLNLLNAVLIYALLQRFFTKNIAVSFSIAALVLIYPADLTHMWLIMTNIRTVVFLILSYAFLLLIYAENGRWIALWGALLCLLLSFGMYEGQLGIAMAWCLLVMFVKRPNKWLRRWGLLLPLVLGILFVLWRTIGYSELQIEYADHGNEELLQLAPIVILSRLMRGIRLMLWAWLEPLMTAFGFTGWQAALFLFLAIALLVSMGYLATRIFSELAGRYLTQQQYLDQLRSFMLLILGGVVLLAAGYFPSIAYFRPTLFQLHTRLNIFPLIGASIIIVALLTVIVLLISKKQGQINIMILTGIMPLLVLGTMVQVQVQSDDGAAWQEQKQIWQQLFQMVPDFKDESQVVLVVPEAEKQPLSLNPNGQRFPFAGGWDIGTGLKMLYGKTSLSGDLAIKESFSKEGVKAYYGDTVTPYQQVIVLTYDGNPKQLRIVGDLAAENLVSIPLPSYKPYEHIINVPTSRTEFRWLVE